MNSLSIRRRQLMASMLAAGGATVIGARTTAAQSPLVAKLANEPVKITQVRAIATAPTPIRRRDGTAVRP